LLGAGDRLAGLHGHVHGSLGDLERGVDLGGVVRVADVVERGLGLGLQVGTRGLWESECGNGDFQERKEARDGSDGGDVEVGPAAEVADVKPGVGVDSAHPTAGNAAHKGWGRVWRAEILQERGGLVVLEGVELDLWCNWCNGILHSRRGIKFVDLEVLTRGDGVLRDILNLGLIAGGSRERSAEVHDGAVSRGDVAGHLAIGRIAITSNDSLHIVCAAD